MKDFLKKYLTAEQLQELETKYIAEHSDAKSLPVYISKERLDEVLTKKKTAEEASQLAVKALEDAKKEHKTVIDAEVTKAVEAANALKEQEISTLKLDGSITEAIYKAKGKNVKAIKALVDSSKDLAKEIERLKKEESYLFEDENHLPTGTGKRILNSDDPESKEEEAMKKAVGIY